MHEQEQDPFVSEKAVAISMHEITAEFVHVTPAMAEEWLDKSEVKNRDWHPSNRKAYAEAMLRGRFLLNGQSIIFDRYGNVLDGHHRLQACIDADVSFDTLIVKGIDRRAMPTIDTGANRDIADELTISSPAHRHINRRVSTTLPLILRYCKGKLPPYYKTVPGRKEILDGNPQITEAVGKVNIPTGTKTLMRESVLGALYYLGGIAHSEETNKYVRELIDGHKLDDGDPASTVRQYLIAATKRLASSRSQMNNWEVFRACALGLERSITGEKLKIVRVSKRPYIPGADPKALSAQFGLEESAS